MRTTQNFVNDAAGLAVAFATSTDAAQTGTSESPSLTVHFDAPSGTYTLTMGSDSEGFSTGDIQLGSTPAKTIYSKSNSDSLTLIGASPSSGVSYTYGGLGAWQQNTNSAGVQNTTFTTFAYGLQTPPAAVPRTGEASFNIDVIGAVTEPSRAPLFISGAGTFDVDFLSGVFLANAYTTETNIGTGATTSGANQFRAGGQLSNTDSTFAGAGSFWDGALNLGGSVAGRFYGPNGQEVGASFYGSDSNGGTLAGSFYGLQSIAAPTVNLTLTNIFVNQTFDAPTAVLQIEPSSAGGYTAINETGSISTVTVNTDGSINFAPPFSNEAFATFAATNKVSSTSSNFTDYRETVGGLTFQLHSYNVGPSNTELALTYTDFGIWRQEPAGPFDQVDQAYYIIGENTPQTVVQHLTGQATYSGVVYGGAIDGSTSDQYNLTGSSSFNVNFSSQSFTGAFNLNGAGLNGVANRNFGSFSLSGTIGYSDNSATISQSGANVGGMNVLFEGPVANELGATFHLTLGVGPTPYSGTYISGVMAAKRN